MKKRLVYGIALAGCVGLGIIKYLKRERKRCKDEMDKVMADELLKKWREHTERIKNLEKEVMEEMIMEDLINSVLNEKGIFVHKATSYYALPKETKYDTYDEFYREYVTPEPVVFTVLIRKTGDEYWCRCGYKNSLESKTVEGISGRDITSKDFSEILYHLSQHIEKIYEYTH